MTAAPAAGRRLPPYARELIDARRGDLRRYVGTSPDGRHPTLFLLAGADCWPVARQWHGRRLLVLLPPGDQPEAYRWECLRDADPVLLWRCGELDGDTLQRLLVAAMRGGVRRVFDPMTGTRYVRGARSRAA